MTRGGHITGVVLIHVYTGEGEYMNCIRENLGIGENVRNFKYRNFSQKLLRFPLFSPMPKVIKLFYGHTFKKMSTPPLDVPKCLRDETQNFLDIFHYFDVSFKY